MSNKKQTTTQNSTQNINQTTGTQYDPAVMALFSGNAARARALADSFQPRTGQTTADANPNLQAYWNMVGGMAANNPGAGATQEAMTGARAAMSYQPQNVTAPTGQSATAGAVQTYNPTQAQTGQAGVSTISRNSVRDVGGVSAGQFSEAGLLARLNPYIGQVVDTTLGDIERSRQMQGQTDRANAVAAKAFGGSRQGVADSLTNEAFQRTAASTAGALRSEGFDKAAGLLAQDNDRALQAAIASQQAQMANQQADFNVGTFNAGEQNQTARFNAGEQNTGNRYNAGLLTDAARFGATAQNEAAQAQAARDQQTNINNTNNQLQALLSNQDAGLAGAGLNLQGAGLLGSLGKQQFDQSSQLAEMLGAAGNNQQGYLQSVIDNAIKSSNTDFDKQIALQQLLNQTLNGIPLQSTQTTTGTTTGNSTGTTVQDPGLLAKIGQGAQTAASIAALFSDRRLKSHIRPIGKVGPHKVYSYRYLWSDEDQIGFMADEVAKIAPQAIVHDASGYMKVDYGRLV